MTWLLSLIMGAGVPSRFAKPALFALGAVLILLALWGSKCAYDKRLIKTHEARQEAANAKADRKADTHAAEQRRADDARSTSEATEIKEAIDEAKRSGADPRAAYYKCVQLQQAARKQREQSPDC